MNIGILSRWNATCGVSMHAELIGREFLKMGHSLRVFAPYVQSANRWWHHKLIREDEDFVIRCYEELHPRTLDGGYIDEEKIFSENLDYLIIESYVSLPYFHVEKLVKKLGNRVTTALVVHEGRREDVRYSSLDIFDAVTVFDERYIREVVRSPNVRIIPYPCHPVKRGRRKFAEDVLTFFSFGRQPAREYLDYIGALSSLEYDFIYRVVRSNGLLPFSEPWLHQERKRLTTEEVYAHLHSSDIHLLPKGKTSYVVVSSTLFQCLGSLTPTVVPDTRHFEALPEPKPVVVYETREDLLSKLKMLIEDSSYRKNIIKAAEDYVERNRSDVVAKKFLTLAEASQT